MQQKWSCRSDSPRAGLWCNTTSLPGRPCRNGQTGRRWSPAIPAVKCTQIHSGLNQLQIQQQFRVDKSIFINTPGVQISVKCTCLKSHYNNGTLSVLNLENIFLYLLKMTSLCSENKSDCNRSATKNVAQNCGISSNLEWMPKNTSFSFMTLSLTQKRIQIYYHDLQQPFFF